ncbi:homing endonuclease associated repeat-containing protein [Candidatus Methylacidithermus pantelleriae]|uniref:Uncharacterized protein n=1 Tax=Candidatus Methylacidithermus pantelleriae TaxID=2744239 RepID=A0A8J2FN10_9BACT|nr:hypothetical protein [Candidatus Methylacidithermus pantelleriae]CAF0692037.1 conserved hypothetical protein [Candidatus Methylacidithermus pantelleriae]
MSISATYRDRNRVWTPELVLEEIRAWKEAGRPLYSHYMRKHFQELLAAGIRYFGSWKQAVEKAGISYEEVRRYQKWSKAKIVETIQRLHRQGVDLSFRAMMLGPYAPMVYAAIRPAYFGSWKDALTAAGLEPGEIYRYRSWTEEQILHEIRRLHQIGADLSSKHMDEVGNSLIATARRRFGSWAEAIRRAGLDYEKIRRRRRWTPEQILEEIRAFHKEGLPLTSTEIRQRYPALFAAACKPRFFGSWRKAVEAALGKDQARRSSLQKEPSVGSRIFEQSR